MDNTVYDLPFERIDCSDLFDSDDARRQQRPAEPLSAELAPIQR